MHPSLDPPMLDGPDPEGTRALVTFANGRQQRLSSDQDEEALRDEAAAMGDRALQTMDRIARVAILPPPPLDQAHAMARDGHDHRVDDEPEISRPDEDRDAIPDASERSSAPSLSERLQAFAERVQGWARSQMQDRGAMTGLGEHTTAHLVSTVRASGMRTFCRVVWPSRSASIHRP